MAESGNGKKGAVVEEKIEEHQPDDLSFKEESGHYPKHVFLIIAYYFCERFSFYGIKTVLQTYFISHLRQSVNTAGSLFHAFSMVAYLTPFVGAVLSDAYLGRYWTILCLSMLYAIGDVVSSLTSLNGGYFFGALIGIFLVAIGAGGVKPCVSAFGADQFPDSMPKARNSFFSFFYVTINAGALLAMFITPLLKETHCFDHRCYLLTFGIPAILMVAGSILFAVGTPFYSRLPPSKNSPFVLLKVIWKALLMKFKGSAKSTDHWLNRAVCNEISQDFVDDCKVVLNVLALFLPIPFFWALFDQQGSRWTLQAQKMNTYIPWLNWNLQAESVQMFNALLIIVSVPFFDFVIYPLSKRLFNLLDRPLQRMVCGCFLSALSFVVIAFIQIHVQRSSDDILRNDHTTYRIRAFNLEPSCDYYLKSDSNDNYFTVLNPLESELIYAGDIYNETIIVEASSESQGCGLNRSVYLNNFTAISNLFISRDSVSFEQTHQSFPDADEWLFHILVSFWSSDANGVAYLSITDISEKEILQFTDGSHSVYQELQYPGRYKAILKSGNESLVKSEDFILEQGGAYTFLYSYQENSITLSTDKEPNVVSVFWQFFPYLLITWSEVMVSVTGLSFAFSQAPESMKSMMQAAWLFSISLGNFIDLLIINLQISNRAVEFFVFGALMAFVAFVFAMMTRSYKYVDRSGKMPSEAECKMQEEEYKF